jgi:Family of unknown function (DUF6049)
VNRTGVHHVRTRARSLALVLLVAVALGALPVVAGARPAAAAPPEIALLGQTPTWVSVGGDVLLRLDVPAALIPTDGDASIRLRIHQAVKTTSTFMRTVDGARLGNRIDSTFEHPLSSFIRDSQGAVYVALGLTPSTRDPSFDVRAPGVYPLEVALRADNETLSSFVTWLVVADGAAPPTNPVQLASVWNVTSAPVRDATGAADPEIVAELSPGGRLDDVATLLEDAAGIPLSLAVGPETVESWEALAVADSRLVPGFNRVKAAMQRSTTQVLAEPYVPIDLPSLEAAGLGGELPNQLRTAADVIERVADVTTSPRTMFIDPVDAPSLARVRDLLVDRVGVRASAIANAQPSETLQPFALAAGDGTMRAAATSPNYEELLASDTSPALRVQRLLAALAVLPFEHPDEPSGVVLAADAHWSPDVPTQRALLAALADDPYVRPVTLDTLLTSVPQATNDGAPVLRPLAPHDPAEFPISTARFRDTQRELGGLRSSFGPEDPVVVQGEHALDLALSTDNSPEEAAADLAVVTDATTALQAGVSTTANRVTLTARKAKVPITFVNDTGKPVRVRVQLASEKLLFPGGAAQVIDLPDGSSTEQFAVEARASGTFTMTVSLATADGNVRISEPTRISVRSAAFSGAGAALTVGALIVLALWWGNHFRRTRRARRAAATTT